MSSTLDLCCELIKRPSISPNDEGCQTLIIDRLREIGFNIEPLPFGEVSNFWARRGQEKPVLCFAGHTDIVPPGPANLWTTDPFSPVIKDGKLYGRGAADMKGGLAAMTTACERFISENPEHKGSIAFLITSDEENIAIDGTKRVIEILEARNEKIDYCIVGEPSSSKALGDVIKNGRRGSLNGVLKVRGQSGHVAYPHLALNPIQLFLPALTALSGVEWDKGNEYFPATSFQISNINAGSGTNNVIPGEMEVLFNFRFSTETSVEEIKQRTESIFNDHYTDYELKWQLSGDPFITSEGVLTTTVSDSILKITGIQTRLSTDGGTSDGRFIAPTGAQVVEIGPSNETIHKNNEYVVVDDLDQLSLIYEEILKSLL